LRLLGFDAAFEGGDVGRHLLLGLAADEQRYQDLADAVPFEDRLLCTAATTAAKHDSPKFCA
jgi:hypothetical protein